MDHDSDWGWLVGVGANINLASFNNNTWAVGTDLKYIYKRQNIDENLFCSECTEQQLDKISSLCIHGNLR